MALPHRHDVQRSCSRIKTTESLTAPETESFRIDDAENLISQ